MGACLGCSQLKKAAFDCLTVLLFTEFAAVTFWRNFSASYSSLTVTVMHRFSKSVV